MTTQIAEYSQTETALAELAGRYKGVVFDVTTKDGMADARKGRAELRTLRTSLEDKRKELKAGVLERGRLIDGEAKRLTESLRDLETPIDEQIRAEETRKERERAEKERLEKERIDGIQQAIANLNAIVPSMAGKSSVAIAERAQALQDYNVGEWAAEFLDTATNAKAQALAALAQLHAGAVAQEAQAEQDKRDRAELARLRAIQEERDRTERERIAAEAKARAEEDAQARARIAAAEREAQARIDAADREARERREAEERVLQAERDRVAAEAKAVEDAARKQREMDEAAEREKRRQETELMDAAALLKTFVTRFGHRTEFAPLVKWINQYLNGQPRKAA